MQKHPEHTAMIVASMHGDLKLVQLLVAFGARLTNIDHLVRVISGDVWYEV